MYSNLIYNLNFQIKILFIVLRFLLYRRYILSIKYILENRLRFTYIILMYTIINNM